MRLLLVSLAALAACAAPPATDGPYGPAPSVPEDEATVGGLAPDQMAALRGLGVPALVPGDVGAFVLDRFEADRGTYGTNYALGYRRADGACFEVSGSNEGLGGPAFPLVSTEVRIADLGRTVRIYQAADDPAATSAQVWGVETVVSDFVELDGIAVLFLSDTASGCRPVSLEEATAIVADLRLLAAGTAASPGPSTEDDFGPFAPADDLLDNYNAASSPQAAAEAISRRYESQSDYVEIRMLSETSYEATALVTAFGLRDDSVRDERVRLTYAPYGPTWELVGAARQVRCQPGRGHADWGAEACL